MSQLGNFSGSKRAKSIPNAWFEPGGNGQKSEKERKAKRATSQYQLKMKEKTTSIELSSFRCKYGDYDLKAFSLRSK